MQPTQPVTGPGGLSSGFVWSSTSPFQPAIPASVLGSYLTPGGPALPTALNPMAALGTPFVSVSDPNSLSTSALLAAAAALQQQQASNLSSLATQSSALKTSTAGSGASVATCRSTPLPSSFSNGSHLSVTSTSELLSALQSQLLLHQQQQQQEQRQVVGVSTHNTSHPSDLIVTMNAVSLPPSSNLAVGSVTTTTTTAQSSTMSLNTTTTTPLDVSSSSLAISAPATVSSVVRVGMKREASSHSASGDGVNGLDLHSRYPAKRPNQNSSYAAGSVPESESSDGASSLCNGTCPSTGPTEQQRTDVEFFKSTADISVPFTQGLALSSTYCGALPTPQLTTSGVSGLLTSTNLYGLPFPTAQAVASSYLPAQPLTYSPVYPTQGTPDNPSSAAALALNSWLTQQQQQQQHNSALHQLQTQVHVTQTNPANPALAAALAAIQQQQQQQRQSPHELSTSSPSPVTFQQQQQQQALLSLFLRAQQSQLAAAQMAAALQGGFVHASPGPRPPAFPGACFFDSAYSFPGSLTGIPGNPYASAVPCLQNPITNVAYINDKGHLLETLPICRDFKAGKCHRNSDCRYVHLVDENVEVNQGRVIVCRDAAKGRCTRVPCKYYHVPLLAISANRSLALNSALATAGFPTA
ncbi:muscleblind-like protein 3 [Clonorchis sinensis]|uniref:Muscleblind-like protein 3 n=1 Tax=Clonorchis sinensis TaxID=79923 RepID=G7YBD4_CLOSI|nr:muscleblind-like protein 3 [Clonorchis sinensis]